MKGKREEPKRKRKRKKKPRKEKEERIIETEGISRSGCRRWSYWELPSRLECLSVRVSDEGCFSPPRAAEGERRASSKDVPTAWQFCE